VQVLVRDNNVDQALKALKKKMQREGIFREMKLRGHYEKPSEKKTREKAEAIRRARKLARKKMQREGLLPMKPGWSQESREEAAPRAAPATDRGKRIRGARQGRPAASIQLLKGPRQWLQRRSSKLSALNRRWRNYYFNRTGSVHSLCRTGLSWRP